jgi:hypothetical protein
LAANGESGERARDIVNKLVAGGHVGSDGRYWARTTAPRLSNAAGLRTHRRTAGKLLEVSALIRRIPAVPSG